MSFLLQDNENFILKGSSLLEFLSDFDVADENKVLSTDLATELSSSQSQVKKKMASMA